jgi:putative tryptophan/tyrosine transport system substrate-binding protein
VGSRLHHPHRAALPKQLELLKEAVPGLTRVGILTNRASDPLVAVEINSAARALRLQLQDLRSIRDGVRGDGAGRCPVALVLKYRLPAIYPWPVIPTIHGGLMSCNTSIADLHRRSASYVDRIVKGAKPGDLPIEQPTKFELVINLRAAKALGLTIPPSDGLVSIVAAVSG